MKKIIILLLVAFINIQFSYSWDKQTHIAIGKYACFLLSDSLGFPDENKKYDESSRNDHYFNLDKDSTVATRFIENGLLFYRTDQDTCQKNGNLYFSIVYYYREFLKTKNIQNLVFLGHFIGDLSNPFHNMGYETFNETHHSKNDAILDNYLNDLKHKGYFINLDHKLKRYWIQNECDLKIHIARIANLSKKLGYKLEKKNRDMTISEAKMQITESISLFRAVLNYVQKSDKRMKLFQCDSKHRNQPCK